MDESDFEGTPCSTDSSPIFFFTKSPRLGAWKSRLEQ
jgi:hypothetical protein